MDEARVVERVGMVLGETHLRLQGHGLAFSNEYAQGASGSAAIMVDALAKIATMGYEGAPDLAMRRIAKDALTRAEAADLNYQYEREQALSEAGQSAAPSPVSNGEALVPTQADRDAAADYCLSQLEGMEGCEVIVAAIRAGHESEADPLVQAFARHAASARKEAIEEAQELRAKLRMIVSHATGGASQDIDASVNDICVRISANRNLVYAHGKEVGREEAAEVAERTQGGEKSATAIRALARRDGGVG